MRRLLLRRKGPDTSAGGEPPRRRWSWLRAVRVAVFIAVLAGWFVYLRPISLGGRSDFIVVSGGSMRPTFQAGDLVVVRKQATYHRGDIVTFRIPQGDPGAGGKVIHRIVGGSARAGFVMKGDHNPSPDLWRPKPANILGRRWLRVPGFGRYVMRLRDPLPLAILVALIVFLSLVLRRPRRRPALAEEEAVTAPEPAVAEPVTWAPAEPVPEPVAAAPVAVAPEPEPAEAMPVEVAPVAASASDTDRTEVEPFAADEIEIDLTKLEPATAPPPAPVTGNGAGGDLPVIRWRAADVPTPGDAPPNGSRPPASEREPAPIRWRLADVSGKR